MALQASLEKEFRNNRLFHLTPIGAAHHLNLDLGKHHRRLVAQLILQTYAYVVTRYPSQATPQLFAQKLSELDIPNGCDFSVTWEEAYALYCLVTGDTSLAQAELFLEKFEAGVFLFLFSEPAA